jgi:hypothetical protein
MIIDFEESNELFAVSMGEGILQELCDKTRLRVPLGAAAK